MNSAKGRIKCIAWDLDNTLWGGVLSEGDPVRLRDKIGHYLQVLDQRGIVHSIVSKNDHADAWKMLQKFNIDSLFIYPQIAWSPKSQSIAALKEKLNIGYDAIAFIDDEPFERDEVAFAHPEVMCCDVDIIDSILEREEFVPRFISPESAKRRLMYLQDEKRDEALREIGNSTEFMNSLGMLLDIKRATEHDLQRLEELTIRTNQMNSTGYTFSYEELNSLIHSPRHMCLVAELNDKYGGYGKIGLALLECDADSWTIKLILVSCRVRERGIGGVLLHYIINEAIKQGYQLKAEFRSTGKNRQMYIAFKLAGFENEQPSADGGIILTNTSTKQRIYPDYIRVQFQETDR